jgi:hypothetical protein
LSSVLKELRNTVAVRWRRDVVGESSSPRRHWNTRENYYRTVDGLLAAFPGQMPDWKAITDEPGRNTSTLSDLFTNGRALRDAYSTAGGPARDLAGELRSDSKPDLLIDETKVWSYWPHRTGWMHQLSNSDYLQHSAITESLVRVLLDWAERQPYLAAAHDHTPPICAIEDFLIVRRGEIGTMDAVTLLRTGIRRKITPPGCSTDGILLDLGARFRPAANGPTPQRQLAEAIERVIQFADGDDETVALVRQEALDLMREGIRVLDAASN